MQRPLNTLLALASLLLAPLCAKAQVAIYEVEFSKPESGAVNFSYYEHAFLVVPGNNGTSSFVFTTEIDGEKFYAIATDSVEVFFVSDGTNTSAIARTRSERGTAKAALLVSGRPDRDLFRPKSNLRIASKLEGRFLASDPESGEAFDPSGGIGFVGISKVKLVFSKSRSDLANYTEKTVAQAITTIERELRFRGFKSETADDDSATTTTTDDTATDDTAIGDAISTITAGG